jgi:hypothetical protein
MIIGTGLYKILYIGDNKDDIGVMSVVVVTGVVVVVVAGIVVFVFDSSGNQQFNNN